jgi:hypothetical protein
VAKGTYLYCIIGATRTPRVRRRLVGIPGTGTIRLLAVAEPAPTRKARAPSPRRPRRFRLWLAVADAPLGDFGEAALNERFSDLDWVSRAAIAHESVIETFIDQPAVLPMKLFTIFLNDGRAIDHIERERRRIDGLLAKVAGHVEWGVRVTFDPSAVATPGASRATAGKQTGTSYLSQKKAVRDDAHRLTHEARRTLAALYSGLRRDAAQATRRSASEFPRAGRRPLLDAAFLVRRTQAGRFRSRVADASRHLQPAGYHLTLTGPWPPYSFAAD